MNKVFSQLQDETDFENALRKIKLKGKELERLPNERRVGCVTVSIQPMKRGAEGLFQKCYNGICNEMNNVYLILDITIVGGQRLVPNCSIINLCRITKNLSRVVLGNLRSYI